MFFQILSGLLLVASTGVAQNIDACSYIFEDLAVCSSGIADFDSLPFTGTVIVDCLCYTAPGTIASPTAVTSDTLFDQAASTCYQELLATDAADASSFAPFISYCDSYATAMYIPLSSGAVLGTETLTDGSASPVATTSVAQRSSTATATAALTTTTAGRATTTATTTAGTTARTTTAPAQSSVATATTAAAQSSASPIKASPAHHSYAAGPALVGSILLGGAVASLLYLVGI